MRIITPGELLGLLPDALAGRCCLAPVRSDADAAALRPDLPLEAAAALIVTTSGSTGRPKAVLLTADALLAAATAAHERLGGPGTWHCPLPLHYIAGAMTLVRALVARTDPVIVRSDLADLAARPGRNYTSLVPTQLHRALDEPDRAAALARFDAILLGGAAAPPELLSRAAASGLRVVTTYGASETCGGVVYDGVPLPGVDVALQGERITLGGPTLFTAYRLDPQRTAETLVEGRFLTSDRGALQQGRLQVLGRLDDLVVTGGVKVDLAFAQRVADRTLGPGVLALIGVPDEVWGTRIVGATASGLTTDEVRGTLAAHLPREALPREVRRVDVLPATPGGKIAVQALIEWWRASGERR